MIIAITGTPGAGKSTLAKELAEKTRSTYLDVNELIEAESDFVLEYDELRETKVVDTDKLAMKLKEIIEKHRSEGKGLIIDSHLSHHVDKSFIDLCIVLSCDISVLKQRLVERGYSDLKIKENLEAESFDEILEEAREMGHDVLNINSNDQEEIENLFKRFAE